MTENNVRAVDELRRAISVIKNWCLAGNDETVVGATLFVVGKDGETTNSGRIEFADTTSLIKAIDTVPTYTSLVLMRDRSFVLTIVGDDGARRIIM